MQITVNGAFLSPKSHTLTHTHKHWACLHFTASVCLFKGLLQEANSLSATGKPRNANKAQRIKIYTITCTTRGRLNLCVAREETLDPFLLLPSQLSST